MATPLPSTEIPNLGSSKGPEHDAQSAPKHFAVEHFDFNENFHVEQDAIRGFAVFVALFCGQDDVAFWVQKPTGLHIARALTERGTLQELTLEAANDCEVSQAGLGATVLSFELAWVSAELVPAATRSSAFVLQRDTVSNKVTVVFDESAIPLEFRKSVTHAAYSSQLLSGAYSNSAPSSLLNHPAREDAVPIAIDAVQGWDHPTHDDLLYSAFERRAQDFPQRLAVDFLAPSGRQTLTYWQLDHLTRSLAARLGQGLHCRIVPALLTTSTELYVSWLSVLRAGLAFCPIPVDFQPLQVDHILKQTSAEILLGVGRRPSWLRSEVEWMDMSQHTQPLVNSSREAADVEITRTVSADDTAYVFFTSGSTGTPKGVQISHRAAVCSISSHASVLPSRSGLRWFQFAAPSFDPSIMEIFTTLSTGGTLCAMPRESTLTDPESALNTLEADIMMATPSLARLLRPTKLTTLKSLWTMGETLNDHVIQNFASSPLPNDGLSTLSNFYGPTEAGINCSVVPLVTKEMRGSIIGVPTATASLAIIDPARDTTPRILPLGLAGELAIIGPQLSAGYLNNPEQTRNAFIHLPGIGRLYRSGDRARVVHHVSGNGERTLMVDFLGRLDAEQVKLSGRRVELGSIESVLHHVDGVHDVCVHADGPSSLVASIVCEPGMGEDTVESRCRSAVVDQLQPYTRPTAYQFFTALPRTVSGKLDRRKISSRRNSTQPVPARSSQPTAENLSIKCLSEALGVDSTSLTPSTSLRSLGLDSLASVSLLQHLRDQGIRDLTAASILRATSISDFQELLNTASSLPARQANRDQTQIVSVLEAFGQRHLEVVATKLAVPASDINRVLPITATQFGMLVSFLKSAQQNTQQRKKYIYHTVYTLNENPANLPALEAAFVLALRRHASFRTVFVPVEDDLAPFAQCELRPTATRCALNVSRKTADDLQEAVKETVDQVNASFRLDQPPVMLSSIQSKDSAVIVLSLFHAVFDGGSLELLLDDVTRIFHGHSLLPVSSTLAAVQRHFSSRSPETAGYWSEYLRDFLPQAFPSLSRKIPRPELFRYEVAEYKTQTTLSALRQGARRHSSSPKVLVQAAYAMVLGVYLNADDVCIGSVESDRLSADLLHCVSPTFVTIPVRVTSRSAKSVRNIMDKLAKDGLAALDHIHAAPGTTVSVDGALPFDTLLALQLFKSDSAREALSLPWDSAQSLAMGNDFALMTEVWPSDDGSLQLRVTFEEPRIERPSALRMMEQVDQMLQIILADSSLSPSNAIERISLQEQPTGPSKAKAAQGHRLMHSGFEKHAQEQPDALALLFVEGLGFGDAQISLTYAELNEAATNLARSLQDEFGSLQRQVVMLCMERSVTLYVSVLAVLKVGAAWCPIDYLSPPARQHELMQRTQSRLVLTGRGTSPLHADALPSGVVQLDVTSMQHHSSSSQLPQDISENDLAYLIFTSGTTGTPKGISITHLNGTTAINSIVDAIPKALSDEPTRLLQVPHFTFDIFVQDLHYTWHVGGTLIASTRDVTFQSFARLANKTKATHANLTPSFGALVQREDLETMRVVTFIGEKLTDAVAQNWNQDLVVFNTFGPAEATIAVTYRRLEPQDLGLKASNIGVPFESVGAYVVSSNDLTTLMPRNAVGELVLTGNQVCLGYWQDSRTTSSKFRWHEKLQQRIYLTGDTVRQLADGTFDFVGRNDDLVKLGGIRVELSEISYALAKADASVLQAEVLLLRPKGLKDQVVVGFVACPQLAETSAPASLITGRAATNVARTVLEHAKKVLPPYMVPGLVVVLNGIPRTPSAKADRKAMAALLDSLDVNTWQSQLRLESDKSSSPEAWREKNNTVLRAVSAITDSQPELLQPSDSLPSIGIDSVRLIKLLSLLSSQGIELSFTAALACRDLREFADAASSAQPEESPHGHDDYVEAFQQYWFPLARNHISRTVSRVLPCLPLQESTISESMKLAKSYWGCFSWDLDPEVQTDRLKDAWHRMAAEVEALRTVFLLKDVLGTTSDFPDDARFLQLLLKDVQLDWTVKPYSGTFQQASADFLEETASNRQRSFFAEPAWAVALLSNQNSTTMVLAIHHSLYDNDSIALLESSIADQYLGRESQLGKATLSSIIAGVSRGHEENKHFWANSLQPIAMLNASTQNEGETGPPSHQKVSHRTLRRTLKTPLAELRTSALALGATSPMSAFRLALGMLVSEFLDRPNVLFAEMISERYLQKAAHQCVGPLLWTIPVAFQHNSGSIREAVKRDTETATQAIKHRFIYGSTVKSLIGHTGTSSMYPAVLAYHPLSTVDKVPAHTPWKPRQDAVELSVEHEFALNIFEEPGGRLACELSVDDSLMAKQEQELFFDQLEATLTSILYNPDIQLNELNATLPTELLSISTPWSEQSWPVDAHPTYWLEHWAKVQPEWTAVEVAATIEETRAATDKLSYSSLNSQGNRVANFITAYGATSGVVAFCLGRTVQACAFQCGIFKTGNTYLPIEEDLPAERKSFLLEDSDAFMVFTSRGTWHDIPVPTSCRVVFVEDLDLSTQSDVYNKSWSSEDLDAASYLLYTSGSTGKPKGVLVTHRNLSCFTEAQSEFICKYVPSTTKLGGQGKWLGLASRAFDVHLAELFLAWRHGFSTTTAPRQLILNDIGLTIAMLNVTHFSCVPSLLDQSGIQPDDVPSLVFVSVGGEKLTPQTKAVWASHSRIKLVNAYGPTEVTVGCCSNLVTPATESQDIGSPMGDCRAHVLVPGSMTYTKRGFAGELCFTGSLVAKGYHKRPDQQGFIEQFNGTRLYRTGDIVRLTSQDHIHFVGRKDSQVKIRGQRVELGEVSEGVRLASSEISIVVVSLILKHSDLSRSQLVSFVSRTNAANRTAPVELLADEFSFFNTVVKENAKLTMPVFMVPDFIIPLSRMPLMPTSAKADNKLLTHIFSTIDLSFLLGSERGKEPVRAFSEDEKAVLDVLKDVLRASLDSVHPLTNLFRVGLDSVTAISACARLRRSGFMCTVTDVLQGPTIEQLAQKKTVATVDALDLGKKRLSEFQDRASKALASEFDMASVEKLLPCMPLQSALVAPALGGSTEALYVNHVLLSDISPSVTLQTLYSACVQLVRRNSILRTCFELVDDQIAQVVLKAFESWSTWSPCKELAVFDDHVSRLKTTAAAEISANLSRTPPLRIHFIEGPFDGQNGVLVSIHHAVYDGESIQLLFGELATLCRGGTLESPTDLEEIVQHQLSIDQEKCRNYWIDHLSAWEQTSLLGNPTASQVSENMSVTERCLEMPLSALEEKVQGFDFTLATLVRGAFAICLAQLLQTDHLIYGTVLSGRSVPVNNPDRIMGPCITTIPESLRLNSGAEDLSVLVGELQKTSAKSLTFQHTAPQMIQRWLQAPRPLYDCLFSYMTDVDEENTAPLWTASSTDIAVDYVLALEATAEVTHDRLVLRVGHRQSSSGLGNLDWFLEKMELLVQSILRNESVSISTPKSQARRAVAGREPGSFTTTWSNTARTIRDTLSKLTGLDVDKIGMDASMISLGIDSVVSIRLAKQLRALKVQVSSADIMRHGSVAQLAKFVDGKTSPADTHQPIPALPQHGPIAYQCTPLQAGMIYNTIASEGRLYVHPHAVTLTPEVDIVKLRKAWSQTVEALDVLRTSFHRISMPEPTWVGIVAQAVHPIWEEHQSSDLKHALAAIPSLDLSSEQGFGRPLVRADLVVGPAAAKVLVITMHHSIYDGLSVHMIFHRLWSAYESGSVPRATPFYDVAAYIQQQQTAAVAHWLGRLVDFGGSTVIEHDTSSYTFASKDLAAGLNWYKDKCQELQVSVQDACALAFAKVLSKLRGSRDVVFGQVLSGRDVAFGVGEDDIVGPTFNTVPVRVTLDSSLQSNHAALSSIRSAFLDGLPHQHASLAQVQKQWRLKNGASGVLLDALFVYQKIEPAPAATSRFARPFDHDDSVSTAATEYGLNLEIEERGDRLIWSASARISQTKLDSLLNEFEEAMQDILSKPERTVLACPEGLAALPIKPSAAAVGQEPITNDDAQPDSMVQSLCSIIATIAQVSPSHVRPETNIFSVGIDSVVAMEVASASRKQGLPVKLEHIMRGLVVNNICRLARESQHQSKSAGLLQESNQTPSQHHELVLPSRESIDHDTVETTLPCLAGQEYHLLSWLHSGKTLFEPAWCYRSTHRLESTRLGKAWAELIERHSVLRTAFVLNEASNPLQVVYKAVAPQPNTFQSAASSATIKAAMQDLARDEARAPSSLESPPIRLRHIAASDADGLALLVHHALYDANTMPLLLDDLEQLYLGKHLPPAHDFSVSVHKILADTDKPAATAYWTSFLQPAQKAVLASQSARRQDTDQAQTFFMTSTCVGQLSALEATCRAQRLSLQNAVVAAFARVVTKYTNTTSPTFGFYHGGRSHYPTLLDDAALGPMVNMLPLVVDVSSGASLSTVAKSVQTILAERIPYEQSSLRDVMSTMGWERLPFNTHLNLLWGGTAPKDASASLLAPLAIGVPTDFSSTTSLEQPCAVDGLDWSIFNDGNLFVDVGPGTKDDLVVGVRADAWLMDERGVVSFVEYLGEELRSFLL